MLAPFHAQLQTISVYCLSSLGELDRARAIFELGTGQPLLDMPEVLWKAYIDFEIAEGENDKARELYSRLLDRTTHVKVCGVCDLFPCETWLIHMCDAFVCGPWLIHMCDAFVCGTWHVTHLYVGRGTHLYEWCVVWLICTWGVWCDWFVCMMGLGTHLYVWCDSLVWGVWIFFRRVMSWFQAREPYSRLLDRTTHVQECVREWRPACECTCENAFSFKENAFSFKENAFSSRMKASMRMHMWECILIQRECLLIQRECILIQWECIFIQWECVLIQWECTCENAFSFNENVFSLNRNAFSFIENENAHVHSHSQMHSHSMCIIIEWECILIHRECIHIPRECAFEKEGQNENENAKWDCEWECKMRLRMRMATQAHSHPHTCTFSSSYMCILVLTRVHSCFREWVCILVSENERVGMHMCDMSTCVRERKCTCVTSEWENRRIGERECTCMTWAQVWEN